MASLGQGVVASWQHEMWGRWNCSPLAARLETERLCAEYLQEKFSSERVNCWWRLVCARDWGGAPGSSGRRRTPARSGKGRQRERGKKARAGGENGARGILRHGSSEERAGGRAAERGPLARGGAEARAPDPDSGGEREKRSNAIPGVSMAFGVRADSVSFLRNDFVLFF